MKKVMQKSLLLFMMLVVLLGWAGAAAASFRDVAPDNRNKLFIDYLSAGDIVSGFPDGTFKPADPLTRAEAAVMLVKAAGVAVNGYQSGFSDVDSAHWAAASIAAAEKAGFLHGYPDGTFRPAESVSRAEGITMVMNLTNQDLSRAVLPALEDLDWEHWAARPVAVALAANMASVTSDGKFFRPDAPMSRGGLARALATLVTIDPDLYQREMVNQLRVLTGSVAVTRADGTKIDSRDMVELLPGDIVVTGAGSSAQIDFADGSGLKMDEKTEIKLKDLVGRSYIKSDGSQGTAVEYLTFDLTRGRLFGALASTARQQKENVQTGYGLVRPASFLDYIKDLLGKPAPGETDQAKNLEWWKVSQTKRVKVKVDMPWGVAAIRGTFWSMAVFADGSSRTSVLQGEGEVTSGGQTVPVTGGQVTQVVQPEKPPAPPAPMAKEDKQQWAQEQQWAVERAKVITEQKPAVQPPPPPAEQEIPQVQPKNNPEVPGNNTPQQPPADNPGQQTGGTPGEQPQIPLPEAEVLDVIQDVLQQVAETIAETPSIEETNEETTGGTGADSGSSGSTGDSGDNYDYDYDYDYDYSYDSTPPSISITSPVDQDLIVTDLAVISLTGTAADNIGISSVTYTINGTTGNAVGTTSWEIAELSLQPGINEITVTAVDTSGNYASASFIVKSLTELIIGEVMEAGYDWVGLADVDVSLYTGAALTTLLSSTVTEGPDSLGQFSLPAAPGLYRLEFAKAGYLTASEMITVVEGENAIFGKLVRQSDTGDGTVLVTVLNLSSDYPISGLTLNFREGFGSKTGTPSATGITASFGTAEVVLPGGYYTVEIVGNNVYPTVYNNLVAVGGQTISLGYTVEPDWSILETGVVETYGHPYYVQGDSVEVRVTDGDANTDPNNAEIVTVKVHATSTNQPDLTVTLTEDGLNSRTFYGSFSIISPSETPGENEIKAAVAEDIAITYFDSLDAYGQSGTTATTMVRVTALAENPVFSDTDPNLGEIGGTLTWAPAVNEDALSDYAVYFVDDYGYPVGDALAVVPKGTPYSVNIPADTPLQAARIGVFSKDSEFGWITMAAAVTQPVDVIMPGTTGIVYTIGSPMHFIGESVGILLTDADLNQDQEQVETVKVHVYSETTDTAGIMVTLTETGISSGMFVGEFTIAGPQDQGGAGQVRADYGEYITVKYKDALDNYGLAVNASTMITVTAPAQNLRFVDQDPDPDQISGDAVWEAAVSEKAITDYVVYFLSSEGEMLGDSIGSIPADGSAEYTLYIKEDTPVPNGAMYIGVFSMDADRHNHMSYQSISIPLTE